MPTNEIQYHDCWRATFLSLIESIEKYTHEESNLKVLPDLIEQIIFIIKSIVIQVRTKPNKLLDGNSKTQKVYAVFIYVFIFKYITIFRLRVSDISFFWRISD